MITSCAILKTASAAANHASGRLDASRSSLIARACDEILSGQHQDMFPLHVWMTESTPESREEKNVTSVYHRYSHDAEKQAADRVLESAAGGQSQRQGDVERRAVQYRPETAEKRSRTITSL